MHSEGVNFVSLNVRGLSNLKKRRSVFTWCKNRKGDIVFIQETHCSKECQNKWKSEWGGKVFFSNGESNARGVSILIKKGLDFEEKKLYNDSSGRYLIVNCEINGKEYWLVNIYAPNKEKDLANFYTNLLRKLEEIGLDENKNIVLGGDFNCCLNPLLDKKGGSNQKQKMSVIKCILQIQSKLNLQDIWRIKNPNKMSFTWSQRKPQVFCRLDFWLLSSELHDFAEKIDIIPAIRTDHSAIFINIKNEINDIKGPGYYKLNTSILDDPTYVEQMTSLLKTWSKESETHFSDNRVKWDWVKFKIREFSISFSKEIRKEQREKEEKTQNVLKQAKRDYEECSSKENEIKLEEAKTVLENIYEERTRGIILRSKVKWHEQGEKNTKYFLNLESRNQSRKHMRKVIVNDKEITNPLKILEAQKLFYKKLYGAQPDILDKEAEEEFLTYSIPKLSQTSKDSCESEISADECYRVLLSFNNGKSPGNDGLPSEFYKCFWKVISPLLMKCYNESFEKGELSSSQKQAVITLISKKDKDKSFLENWRPISLINVDEKMLSKTLAWKLKKVLPEIIHSDQSGYVENRNISETVRSILDMMEYTQEENLPGVLLFLDFKKAFDSLSWSFLKKTLEVFNFGPNFRKWIDVLYNNVSSCTINNGLTSGYFNLERGVRQGDPLSPYLFIMAVELLAIRLRRNENIKGISIGNYQTKLLQYADDTTATLSDIESAKEFLRVVNNFGKCSGLNLNLSKTEGLWLGSLRHSKDKPLGIKWPDTPIKSLGVYYTYDDADFIKLNFHNRLSKMKTLVDMWKCRGLTHFGRVTIVKSLILPIMTYIFSVLSTPKQIITELNTLMFSFIWKGKDKVKRNSTYSKYENGGLEMIDIETYIMSLRLSWLKRLCIPDKKWWKEYFIFKLRNVGGAFFLKCNYDVSKYNFSLNTFYLELLQYWTNFKSRFDINHDDKMIIWNNKDIEIGGKSIFNRILFAKNIITVYDLHFDLDNIKSFQKVKIDFDLKSLNILQWSALRLQAKKIITEKANLECTFRQESILDTLTITMENGSFDASRAKSKDYYRLLIKLKQTPPLKMIKLKTDFSLNDEEIKSVYTLAHNTFVEMYPIDFQYRLINYILYTNVLLYKIGIVESPLCSFCCREDETIYHLFYFCEIIKDFWNKFTDFWQEISNDQNKISFQQVFIGDIENNAFSLKNYLLILGKIHIYSCRKNKEKPNINAFLTLVSCKYEVEKSIASRRSKRKEFDQKWGMIKTKFEDT